MEKLRIDNGVRYIEVNDAGESISVNLNDTRFFERFAEFLKGLESRQGEADAVRKEFAGMMEKADAAEKNGEDETETLQLDFDKVMAAAKRRTALCEWACENLDRIFGEGCCRKVFGNVTPDESLIEEFLDAVTPILDKFAAERHEKIRLRYNRGRKGANSK